MRVERVKFCTMVCVNMVSFDSVFVMPAKAGIQLHINFLLLPRVQHNSLHPFGGVNTR